MNRYDVIVVGAGVVGNAVARELSAYNLSIAVLEKEPDLCFGTSGRNSGVLHAGFNNKTGSKMARFCVEGNLEFDKVAKELDIPFKRTGKLVIGFNDDDKKRLLAMKEQGDANGVPGLEIVGKERIKELAPYIDGEFAMYSPMTGILNPFIFTIALAENANKNGAEYFFNCPVTAIDYREGSYYVKAGDQSFQSRWIINCAGLGSDKISDMLGIKGYKLYPNRGEYYILDKKAGKYLDIPAYPVPNPKEGGLGIHITPSIDGNILIGPSSKYIEENDNYAVTQDIMDLLVKDGSKIFPYIKREYFIRNFAGIRPKLAGPQEGGYADFIIERRSEAPYAVNLVGIESPGLTSALPIAREVIRLIQEVEVLEPNPNFDPVRKGSLVFAEQTEEKKRMLIKENPNYGEIICRCETVTKAEVLDAICRPLGATTVTGVKYRCRSMMGRCQGGYCLTRITELLCQEKNLALEEVLYQRKGSNMFTGVVLK